MRELADKKEIIKHIEEWFQNETDRRIIQEVIKATPTVINIDLLLDELNKEKISWLESAQDYSDTHEFGVVKGLCIAISIVKEQLKEFIEYKHTNGYSARLYGKSSMSIYFNGKEVMHTGFRSVNTKDEVMGMLENYPNFRNALLSNIDEILADEGRC